MKNLRQGLLFLMLVIVASIAAIQIRVWGAAIALATNPEPQIDVTALSDRTQWHQVNTSPYNISALVNALCAPPIGAGRQAQPPNPHANAAITVFVNNMGRDAMLSSTPAVFPVGSVIVKQKVDPNTLKPKVFPDSSGKVRLQVDSEHHQDLPLLYTVMIKRERGYNPEAGDWEFAVVSGDGKQIQARGVLATCMSCHIGQRSNDYVFRTYLGH